MVTGLASSTHPSPPQERLGFGCHLPLWRLHLSGTHRFKRTTSLWLFMPCHFPKEEVCCCLYRAASKAPTLHSSGLPLFLPLPPPGCLLGLLELAGPSPLLSGMAWPEFCLSASQADGAGMANVHPWNAGGAPGADLRPLNLPCCTHKIPFSFTGSICNDLCFPANAPAMPVKHSTKEIHFPDFSFLSQRPRPGVVRLPLGSEN